MNRDLVDIFMSRLDVNARNTLTAIDFRFEDSDEDALEAMAEGVIDAMFSYDDADIGFLEVLSMNYSGVVALMDLETAEKFATQVFGLKLYQRFVPPGTTAWAK